MSDTLHAYHIDPHTLFG